MNDNGFRFRVAADEFKKIPGNPIAYWMSGREYNIFKIGRPLSEFSKGSTGLQTSNSERFIRLWFEISNFNYSKKWIPFAKGGQYRKWYGNVDHVVNWSDNGKEIKDYVIQRYPYLNGNFGLVVKNENTYFERGILTSRITTGKQAFRIKEANEIYADACTAIFPKNQQLFLALLSTKLLSLVGKINPTLNFQAGDIERFPVMDNLDTVSYKETVQSCLNLAEIDWNQSEVSNGFVISPLLEYPNRKGTIVSVLRTPH